MEKLRKRRGQPGYGENTAAIEQTLAGEAVQELAQGLASETAAVVPGVYRSAITGKFVSPEYAAANPATTVKVG